jgi:hypothetical protein
MVFIPLFKRLELLIAKPILSPAVWALPGNAVTGHPPHIFIHAFLADHKAASATPTKGHLACAAMAAFRPLFSSPIPAFFSVERIAHTILNTCSILLF